jgi:TIR domain
VAIRSGERWRERLPELIAEADVFQLFWSSNSMRSRYCREEWEHALALRRPSFVRPFYWEDPRPEDPANGLPPAALDALEFVKVSLFAAQREVPVFRGADPARPGQPLPPQDALYPPPRGRPEAYSYDRERLSPMTGHRRSLAQRRRLAVAALVLVVIAVAVFVVLRLLGG